MRMTSVGATARGPSGIEERVEFLVDSGAMSAPLPAGAWRRLRIEPKRTMTFTLADGTNTKRSVGECHLAIAGADRHSPVILGEPGDDEPLLGAVTPVAFGLVLDPFRRELLPMPARLA